MAAWTINSKNLLTQWGIRVEGDDGFLDQPPRKGITEHDWLDENGVEQYTQAADIRWGARDLTLNCYMRGTSLSTLKTYLNSFKAEIIQAGSQTLYHPHLGTSHNVYFKDGFAVRKETRWNSTTIILRFAVRFREHDPAIPA